jgi:hypothetical protein
MRNYFAQSRRKILWEMNADDFNSLEKINELP